MNLQEIILQYVKPELLVLIPVLYLIGLGLKKAGFVADKYIPLILGACGILLSFVYLISVSGWNVNLILAAIIQGVLTSAGAVYFNQIYKQLDK